MPVIGRRHQRPTFGNYPVADIRKPLVRRWRRELLADQASVVTRAKAYRLLKAIRNTAVEDRLIGRNPCRIKGAGQERSAGWPVLTIAQVFVLADMIDQRYRGLVLLSSFASLRWSELVERAGFGELHLHDLRHTGNHLAAGAKATLRELINRMGHSTAAPR
jgi:integrase